MSRVGLPGAPSFATLPFADRIGYDRAQLIGYTTIVLAFMFIFFGIRSYRDNVGYGTLTFGRGFVVGALRATNTWDFPTYLLLAAVAVVLRRTTPADGDAKQQRTMTYVTLGALAATAPEFW